MTHIFEKKSAVVWRSRKVKKKTKNRAICVETECRWCRAYMSYRPVFPFYIKVLFISFVLFSKLGGWPAAYATDLFHILHKFAFVSVE